MDSDTLKNIVACDWLCSDGVIASEPALYSSRIPPIPPQLSLFRNRVGLIQKQTGACSHLFHFA